MSASGMLARPLLAGIFVVGGFDALRDPESKAKAADDVAPQIAAALGLPTTDTVTLVRINGGIQVVAGTLLALGKGRRLAALVLAASLIPTTYAGHRFWNELDDEQRAQQRIQFLKNLAMLGGLVLAAGDTGGRATVGWQARRATRHAMDAAAAAGAITEQAAQHLLASSGHARDAMQGGPAHLAHQAHDLAQSAWPADLAGLKGSALKAAKKAALKGTKAQFSRRALKATHKAARTAGRQARDVAQKVDASDAVEWARDAAATVGQEIGARAHEARSLVS
jgi:putative oxidoreductase